MENGKLSGALLENAPFTTNELVERMRRRRRVVQYMYLTGHWDILEEKVDLVFIVCSVSC